LRLTPGGNDTRNETGTNYPVGTHRDRWIIERIIRSGGKTSAVNLTELQSRVAAVEAAVQANRASERRLADELDRLAEHLIGETGPELQHVKQRIQILVSQLAPQRQEVEVYIETYCRVR
jgi:hypothetical protein